MAAHYWNGSKLLYADTRIASKLLSRLLAGRTLTRREHQLLVRVCADIARLVPLAFFVIVPMMEFALPLAIRLFPNLLPSTFEEKHHVEEKRKKLLKVRMEMAQLLQHTLGERAIQVTKEEKAKAKRKADRAVLEAAMAEESTSGPAGAMSLVESRARELSRIVADTYTKEPVISANVREFMVRMKEGGRASSTEELLSVMKGFKDNVTLDHLYRDQLVAMAQFLGMNHFAPTGILRFQLRQRLRRLRNDDKDILWEGLDNLSEGELKADLRARGLPTTNLTKAQMKDALSDWLKISQVKEVPYSLLILTNMLHFAGTRQEQKEASRLGAQTQDTPIDLAAAQAAMSSLPSSMAVQSTLVDEVSNDEKLEALRREEALVEEERLVRESMPSAVEVSQDENDELLDDARGGVPGSASSAQIDDEEIHLSRDQIADIAEAIDTMHDPLSAERAEMAELEADRVRSQEAVEEAKSSSNQVAMLDSRVTQLMEKLRAEMEDTEISIGDAFKKLDLDNDGILSRNELVGAMDSLHFSKRPDARAFEKLLERIDADADGQISVADFRRLMREMQMRVSDEGE